VRAPRDVEASQFAQRGSGPSPITEGAQALQRPFTPTCHEQASTAELACVVSVLLGVPLGEECGCYRVAAAMLRRWGAAWKADEHPLSRCDPGPHSSVQPDASAVYLEAMRYAMHELMEEPRLELAAGLIQTRYGMGASAARRLLGLRVLSCDETT